MVQITGKYKRTSIENFEEFLNEVGVGVLLRKAALASTPTMEISKSGEKWKMVTSTILKVNKVHIFWEGHKISRNLPLTFDYSTYSQRLGEDFAKFCGVLRIYELYSKKILINQNIFLNQSTSSGILLPKLFWPTVRKKLF